MKHHTAKLNIVIFVLSSISSLKPNWP